MEKLESDLQSRLVMLESRVHELEYYLAQLIERNTGENPEDILEQVNKKVHRRYQNAMYLDNSFTNDVEGSRVAE